MKVLSLVFRELAGMFVDDEFLAIAVLAVVGLAASCQFIFRAPESVAGGVLLVGCLAVLISSVAKSSKKS